MPPFLVAFLVALAPLLEAFVFRALVAVGVTYATYSGLSVVTDSLRSSLDASFGGLASQVAALAYLLSIDRAVNLLLSAVVGRVVLGGLTSAGTLSRFKVGAPPA